MLNVDFIKQEMEEEKFLSDLQNSKGFWVLLKILKAWDHLNKEMWIFENRGVTFREAADISEISSVQCILQDNLNMCWIAFKFWIKFRLKEKVLPTHTV